MAGLLLAARRFDSQLGTPFWAYATFWVRKAMQELVAELARPVALSDRAARDLTRIRAARYDHLQSHGAEPTEEELSLATGLTPAQIESLRAADRLARSTEERLTDMGPAGMTVGEAIVDPRAEAAYQDVLDRHEIHHVLDLTDALEERERTVIRGHYGLGQEARTLGQIGAELGLTAERARQIESAALGKLRDSLARPAPIACPAT